MCKTDNITRRGQLIFMRFSEKSQLSNQGANDLLGVDLHDFVQKEQGSTYLELASEFGLSLNDVRKLKRQLDRS